MAGTTAPTCCQVKPLQMTRVSVIKATAVHSRLLCTLSPLTFHAFCVLVSSSRNARIIKVASRQRRETRTLPPCCAHCHPRTRRQVLDDAIGNVTAALKAHDMWTNTLLFVIADNGGDNPGGRASNYPLVVRIILIHTAIVSPLGVPCSIDSTHIASLSELRSLRLWYRAASVSAGREGLACTRS